MVLIFLAFHSKTRLWWRQCPSLSLNSPGQIVLKNPLTYEIITHQSWCVVKSIPTMANFQAKMYLYQKSSKELQQMDDKPEVNPTSRFKKSGPWQEAWDITDAGYSALMCATVENGRLPFSKPQADLKCGWDHNSHSRHLKSGSWNGWFAGQRSGVCRGYLPNTIDKFFNQTTGQMDTFNIDAVTRNHAPGRCKWPLKMWIHTIFKSDGILDFDVLKSPPLPLHQCQYYEWCKEKWRPTGKAVRKRLGLESQQNDQKIVTLAGDGIWPRNHGGVAGLGHSRKIGFDYQMKKNPSGSRDWCHAYPRQRMAGSQGGGSHLAGRHRWTPNDLAPVQPEQGLPTHPKGLYANIRQSRFLQAWPIFRPSRRNGLLALILS